MLDVLEIANTAKKLKQKYNTQNPFDICKSLGIIVKYAELGNVKGFYKYYKRNRFIVINSSVECNMQRVVCAHELGHDVLHMDIAKSISLWENTFFDISSQPELEANIFAAELLTNDDDIINACRENTNVSQYAAASGIDVNFVKLKLIIMKQAGYNVNDNFAADSDFLGKV